MRFESFIGRRHLFSRERTLLALVSMAVGSLALAVGVVALLFAMGWILGFLHPSVEDLLRAGIAVVALAAVLFLVLVFGWLLRMRISTLISIVSVAVGVGALIVVIAVLDGLDATFHRKYMDLVAQIEALPPTDAPDETFADPAAVEQTLGSDPHVLAIAPEIRREAFLLPDRDFAGRKSPIQLLGVDPAQMSQVARFVDRTVEGTGNPGPDEVVLGQLLAQYLLVRPGDTVWAITRIAVDANGPHLRWAELKVAGTFVTGIPDLDMATAYVNLETARRIFVLPPDAVSAFLLRTASPYQAGSVAREIGEAHPDLGARLRSWDETNQAFFHALRLEKVGTFVMLLMIILVASFNIVGTLVMIVTERTREIGILKTMGASDPVIRRIFLRSGLLIGLLGTGLGLAGGLTLAYLIGEVIPVNIPLMLYDLQHFPILINWPTVVLVTAASIGICLLASVLPAQSAARLDPIEALRRD
jgi:lipoprotein-releasing system permease protein